MRNLRTILLVVVLAYLSACVIGHFRRHAAARRGPRQVISAFILRVNSSADWEAAMTRRHITTLAGIALTAIGLALVLGAHAQATTWQQLGTSAWDGETDVHQESLYRTLGFILLPFGLVLITVVAYRSLACEQCRETDSSAAGAT
jgi:hypothetical protein